MAVAPTPDQQASEPILKQLGKFSGIYWIANWMELVERFAYYGVRVVLPVFMVAAFEQGGPEFTHIQKGTIYAIWALVQSFVPLFTGGFADRYGYKVNIALSTVLKIIGYLVMGYAIVLAEMLCGMPLKEARPLELDRTYEIFFAGAMFLALGTAIFKPGLQGLIAHQMPKENSSMGWGVFYQMVNIGGFIGPMLAGVLRILDWKYVFLACAIGIALNFIPLLMFREPDHHGDDKEQGPLEVLTSAVKGLLEPRLFFFTICFAGFWLMFYQLFDILPNFIDDWVDSRAAAALVKDAIGGVSLLYVFAGVFALVLGLVVMIRRASNKGIEPISTAILSLAILLCLVGQPLLSADRAAATLQIELQPPVGPRLLAAADEQISTLTSEIEKQATPYNKEVFSGSADVLSRLNDHIRTLQATEDAPSEDAAKELIGKLNAQAKGENRADLVSLLITAKNQVTEFKLRIEQIPEVIPAELAAAASGFVAGLMDQIEGVISVEDSDIDSITRRVTFIFEDGSPAQPSVDAVYRAIAKSSFDDTYRVSVKKPSVGWEGAPRILVPTINEGNLTQEWMINFNALLISLFAFLLGFITGKVRALNAIVVGIVVSAVAIYGLGMSMSGWWILAMIGLFSFGEMTASPTKMRYLASIAPPGKEGLYMGYVNFTVGIGWSIGSIIAGKLYEEGGDKVVLARKYLIEEQGVAKQTVDAISKNDLLPYFQETMNVDAWGTRDLLWETYTPYGMWTLFMWIGLGSMVGIWIYNKVTHAADKNPNHAFNLKGHRFVQIALIPIAGAFIANWILEGGDTSSAVRVQAIMFSGLLFASYLYKPEPYVPAGAQSGPGNDSAED
jgi:dipeptide/tripeptide permease